MDVYTYVLHIHMYAQRKIANWTHLNVYPVRFECIDKFNWTFPAFGMSLFIEWTYPSFYDTENEFNSSSFALCESFDLIVLALLSYMYVHIIHIHVCILIGRTFPIETVTSNSETDPHCIAAPALIDLADTYYMHVYISYTIHRYD